jgi:RES domain-containing protein
LGDGAAVRGARFNPQRVPTLYVALSIMTAVKEINQGFAHKIEPCVLCSCDVDCEDVVDLRAEAGRNAAGVSFTDMACAWFFDISQRKEPPSWRLARKFIDAGKAGILVPSFAPSATAVDQNLVLWKWGKSLPHKVSVYDPSGQLPKDQLSWK